MCILYNIRLYMMRAMRIIKIYLNAKWHPAWPNPTIQWKYKHFKFTRYSMRIKWNAMQTQSCHMKRETCGTWNMKQFKVNAFFFLKDFFLVYFIFILWQAPKKQKKMRFLLNDILFCLSLVSRSHSKSKKYQSIKTVWGR